MAASDDRDLERTLGLRDALAIGTGTMIGAGIFVFPGLAAGQAGPAAAVSFAIGAGVALLVALPASELATAMPRSGGGYFFVSRALGAWAGTLVGVSQWLGLMFASAFYLVGFGAYVADAVARAGLALPVPSSVLALAAAVVLTGVGVVGAEKTGGLQKVLVGVLLVLLAGLLGVGALAVVGVTGAPQTPGAFAPYGLLPIATTAALVFTSYLGFVQVATVAGEVQTPARTLPRAMIGSVLLVGALYVLTLLLATSLFPSERLDAFGETALVEVGQRLLGVPGALLVLAGGLLATLSSANASILSASRAVFALSKDRLAPEGAARVNRRFGTPHVSIALAGSVTAALILLGQTELLAEVASLLHLVLYGMICVALVVLRRRAPAWYAPRFRSPGGLWLPALGALASFGLVAFMQPRSWLVGGGLLLAAGAWHLAYGRRAVLLPPPAPGVPVPDVALRRTTLLVPLLLPDAPGLSPALARVVSAERALVVGVRATPRATGPDQARETFGGEVEAAVEACAEALREAGAAVETRTAFATDPVEVVNRLAAETDADALLIPAPAEAVRRALVPVRDDRNAERLATYAAGLARRSNGTLALTLYHVAEDDGAGDALLADLRREILRRGVPPAQVETELVDADAPADALADVAADYDLVLLGETEPAAAERTLGDLPRRLLDAVGKPVLVVRAPHD